jgi:hypothetical protein
MIVSLDRKLQRTLRDVSESQRKCGRKANGIEVSHLFDCDMAIASIVLLSLLATNVCPSLKTCYPIVKENIL